MIMKISKKIKKIIAFLLLGHLFPFYCMIVYDENQFMLWQDYINGWIINFIIINGFFVVKFMVKDVFFKIIKK